MILLSLQIAQPSGLRNPTQLTFPDDPLVWFGCAFDPILIVITFGRQELDDLIDTVRAAATKRSRRKTHRLADFEFVLVHKTSKLPSARRV
jgi:hypothetical protein